MFKGIVSLALEAILFCFFYSLWNPMFENRREQERCELILKSITEEKCEQGLYTYLSKCQVLNKPIVKNICLTNKHLDINSDVASCKVKGEVTFFYKGKKYNSSFSAEGVSDTIIYPSTISHMIFDGIYIKDTYGKLSLNFDFLGDIVIEPLKIGESITVDGIKCVFERKWESGEWYMKTSKVLMPAQMYKVFENPKCKNSGGIRFSTEENLLYGCVTDGQIFVPKSNGAVYRYTAKMVDNNVKLWRIE